MPSPKSGTAGSPIAPNSATKASDFIVSQSSGTCKIEPPVAQIQGTRLRSNAVSDRAPVKPGVTSPKTLPPPPKSPPPIKKSDKPCGVSELQVQCSHKVNGKTRTPGPGGVLQIVPSAVQDETSSYDFLGVVEVKVKGAGKDTITAKVKSVDGKSQGRKQTCLMSTGAPPSDNVWETGETKTHDLTYEVQSGGKRDSWPKNAPPRVLYVYGRGCDEVVQRSRIEIFPSQQFEVSIDASAIQEWIDDLKGGLLGFVLKVFGDEEEADFKFCQGKLIAAWGWQEAEDWRAFYNVQIDGALDPLVQWEHEFTFSMLKVALAAAGVPPPLADVGTKYLADVYVSFLPNVSLGIRAGIRRKYFATGQDESSGTGRVEAGGSLELALAARLGSKYVVAVMVSAGGKTGVKGTGDIEIDREGLFVMPKVEVGGLILFVQVKFVAFKKTAGKKRKEWQAVDPRQVYPTANSEARWKLLPREQVGRPRR